MIHQAVIDRILQSLDLPAFIGERVTLAKHSETYEGLCPFHTESSASFKVFRDHYHCFGCGAHGNAIDFLIGHQGLSFPEAVRALAAHTGVEVPTSREGRFKTDELLGLRSSLRRACAEYQRLLLSPQGAGALAVLSERGIEHDTIVRFGIGFVPDAWGTLTKARGCDRRSLVAAGLAVPRKGNRGCYDFFRNRLMFPVSSDSGEVVGFGGRRIGLERPKYLNTPETALYKKGLVLFGLHQARQAIRTTGSVIVCEGFFVVFTPSQAGVEPIVSTCGTAITPTQAERVLTVAGRVFFCFDGDAAGAKATGRAAKMLLPLVSDLHARGNDTGGPCQGPRHGGHAVATHYRTWPLDILSTIRLRSPTAVAPRLRPCCGNGPDGRTQRTRTSVPMLRGPGNGPSRGR